VGCSCRPRMRLASDSHPSLIRVASESNPTHIRAASESYPSHIRVASESHPSRIRVVSESHPIRIRVVSESHPSHIRVAYESRIRVASPPHGHPCEEARESDAKPLHAAGCTGQQSSNRNRSYRIKRGQTPIKHRSNRISPCSVLILDQARGNGRGEHTANSHSRNMVDMVERRDWTCCQLKIPD
jgi:hypothetical protein